MVGGNAYSDALVGGDGDDASAALAAGLAEAYAGDEGAPTPSPPAVQSSAFFGAMPPRELYMRWCAANALLPAVQFSIAPWQYDAGVTAACRRLLERRAAATGAPLVRPLWWHDPHDPTCLWIDDQFLL